MNHRPRKGQNDPGELKRFTERILKAALSSFETEERLHPMLHELMSFLQVDSGGIYLVEGDQLLLRVWKGLPERLRSSLESFPVADPPVWACRPYLWRGGSGGEEPALRLASTEGIAGWCSLPLDAPQAEEPKKGEWVGTLFVAHRRGHAGLGPEDMAVLADVAGQFVLAIDHSRARQQAERRLIRLKALRDIDGAIIRRLKLEDILKVVLEHVPASLGADSVAVTLLEGAGDRSHVFAMRLPNGRLIEEEAFTLAESLLHWLVDQQETVIIYNVAQDPRVQMHRPRLHATRLQSYLGVPLLVHGRTIGILHILSRDPKVFAEEDVDFFKTMAGQSAIAIANARLLDQAEQQARELQERLEELERAKRSVTESHRQLAEAQRLARVGSWEWDVIQQEARLSDEVYRIFGLSPEEFRGTYEGFLERVHPDDRERVREAMKRAWHEQEPYDVYHRIILPDGSVREVYERAQVVRDDQGAPVRMVGTVQDVTELRQLERSLRESEVQFRSVVEFCPVGIMIVQEGRVAYQNPEQERILGLPQGASILEALLPRVHPEDREQMLGFLGGLLGAGRGEGEAEARFSQEGEEGHGRRPLWCHCRGSSMIYGGQPALLLTMTDITEKREMERIVASRERMASLGQVAAGIAHEIRSPLSGINVFLDAIRENLGESGNMGEIRGLLDEAKEAARRIEGVIRKVLDFSRHTTPRMRPRDLNESVQNALALARTALRKSGIQLEVDCAPDLPPVLLDGQLMEQVVLNLVGNAMDALSDFEGPRHLTVSTRAGKEWVGLRVRDSGPGVPPEVGERIFEPFYTRKKKGTGIGLSLCRRIVSDHGGSLELYNAPGGGTVAEVRLPREERTEGR